MSETKNEQNVVGTAAPAGAASFGKFQLVAQLGKGGMGDVFLAVARGMQGFKKLVVIKRLHETLADDERSRTLFLEEGRLAARLNHPNVVQTNEVGELDGALYLSMEYLEGHTCLQVARHWKANENPRMVARIISDALAGLHYAHELVDYDGTPLKIVHRDLSPHNIFITYEGVVKILDFGIAKAAVQSSQTEVGVFKGKVAYMAPEQLDEGEIDRRVDIFVVGIVLWELLAAQRLFKAEDMAKTFQQLLYAPIPRLSTIVPNIDPTLEAIVARALERDVEKRFQTAQDLRDALEAYLEASGPPVRQADLGVLVRQLFRQRREWVRERVRAFMSVIDEVPTTNELPSLATPRRENEWTSRSGVVAIPANDSPSPAKSAPPARSLGVMAASGAAVAAIGVAMFVMFTRTVPQAAPASAPVLTAVSAPAAPPPTVAPPPHAPSAQPSPQAAATAERAPAATNEPAAEPSGAPSSAPHAAVASVGAHDTHPAVAPRRMDAPASTAAQPAQPGTAPTAATPAPRRKFRTEL